LVLTPDYFANRLGGALRYVFMTRERDPASVWMLPPLVLGSPGWLEAGAPELSLERHSRDERNPYPSRASWAVLIQVARQCLASDRITLDEDDHATDDDHDCGSDVGTAA
jgi:hypothetical protein